ncbi:MAG: hypothetical protein ACRD16_07570 [Thermoanaerobaculia bacterium]
MRIQPIRSTLQEASEIPELAIATPTPVRKALFPRIVETAGEVLWAVLLVLVIGFLISKAPAINAVFDDAATAFHRSGEPVARADEAEIQDLELRMGNGERKLSDLERGYAQLKQRHADLLRAYAELLETRQAEMGGGTLRAAK